MKTCQPERVSLAGMKLAPGRTGLGWGGAEPTPKSHRYVPALFFFFNFLILFTYLWLCWVFVSVRGLSPVEASGGHSSSRCAGLSLPQPLLLRSTGSRRAGSVVVAHGPSRSAACGIFPDQGSNPCLLHWQADSQSLRHQGSPMFQLLKINICVKRTKLQVAEVFGLDRDRKGLTAVSLRKIIFT